MLKGIQHLCISIFSTTRDPSIEHCGTPSARTNRVETLTCVSKILVTSRDLQTKRIESRGLKVTILNQILTSTSSIIVHNFQI